MHSLGSKATIEELVQESMFGLIKGKTGIKTPVQIRLLEFLIAFKKSEGRIKVSSVFIKRKMLPHFERVTESEIKFSGATNNEFIDYLRKRGARQVSRRQSVLESL